MMTVGVAQSRINEMNAITEELADCIKKMRYEENKDRIKSLEEEEQKLQRKRGLNKRKLVFFTGGT